jgi:hypothetical protein
MTQANRAKINMAAIHRRMSGRHFRQKSINSGFMFHHIVLLTDTTAARRSPRA